MTEDYVSPMEPEPNSYVSFRFRTAKNNVDNVFLCIGGIRLPMRLSESYAGFDFYFARHQIKSESLSYHFEIESGNIRVTYDRNGCKGAADQSERADFRLIPGFKTPDWAKGAVMYQIFTDRFFNGDRSNDVATGEYYYVGGYTEHVENWDSPPQTFDIRRFYGGDLSGVIQKLPFLQSLGINAIYFNPLFVSPSNHKYDIQDYDYIDPHYGRIVRESGELLSGKTDNRSATRYITRVTDKANLEASNELFISLVKKAHELGIKVIIDGVFNHCGSFNKWLDRECIYEDVPGYEKGAFVSKESPYHSFFSFYQDDWPYNSSYDGWWGHDTLPKLNYEGSKELVDYILRVARKWVSPPFNCDGWRLDVAADLGHSPEFNHEFWKKFREAVKSANPDAVIIAEHYGDARSWLQGDQWDTVMNYDAFMEPVSWFLTGMQKHSDIYRGDLLNNEVAFWNSMRAHQEAFTCGSLMSAMNELSNHDHSRFLTRTNHTPGRLDSLGSKAAENGVNKAVMREAVLLQFTWIGAPTIYYGDEAGLCGFTDPDNRRPYPWGREDFELVDFHRACARIHNENRELRMGSLIRLAGGPGYLAYARVYRREACIILINNNSHEIHASLSLQPIIFDGSCTLKRLIMTDENTFTTTTKEVEIRNESIQVSLPNTSGELLKVLI
ncbi:MAG: glycoside hydrolase family 13 protein [Lachnospiraceae bacterium]|nr:glycoside hydrolase family 13 protein [Lachnospiraceae bacterium]